MGRYLGVTEYGDISEKEEAPGKTVRANQQEPKADKQQEPGDDGKGGGENYSFPHAFQTFVLFWLCEHSKSGRRPMVVDLATSSWEGQLKSKKHKTCYLFHLLPYVSGA